MVKHNEKELTRAHYQADISLQTNTAHQPPRLRAPKHETTGRVLRAKKGSRIRGMGSKSAARKAG
jgi:hypothetical protein